MKKLHMAALAMMLAAGILTACGGGGQAVPEVEPNGNTVDLHIEATNFQFNEKEYRVKSGDTVILLTTQKARGTVERLFQPRSS